MIAKFRNETGWNPARIKPLAGALPDSKYNFFMRFILKRVALKMAPATNTSHD